MKTRLQAQLVKIGSRLGFRRDWYLIALASVIGCVTGLGAIGFKWLLDYTAHHGIEFQREFPLWTLALLPMVGALFSGIIIHFFAPEARGHGVPEVMDAVYRKGSKIRPRVAFAKAISSILTIGSGGSAGAEGPIVQIGSSIGSLIAQVLHVSREQAATLLGCGAAAGIASVFNAPIAGVFFVLEILLRDFSLRTFTPIVVASVFSTAVTQAVLGQNEAIFAVSDSLAGYEFSFVELPGYLVLGLFCGAVAVGFTRALYFTEDLYDRLPLHGIIKPVTGAAMLGVLGMIFLLMQPDHITTGVPNFFGNGYETITALLSPEHFRAEYGSAIVQTGALMLLALVAFKALATCLTLGSGGSGGVFAPSLFLGAAAGAAYGEILDFIGLLPDGASPASYALVGMAALVAGTTHAPLTAILILFELTRDVYVLLPIMLAAVMSVVVAQLLLKDSIYSLKLRRRGVLIGTSADLTILRRLTARDIQPIPHVSVHPDDPLNKLLELRDVYKVVDFVVVSHDGHYLGLVTAEDMRIALIEREAIPYLLVEELLRRDLPVIYEDETLDRVLEKFSMHDVSSLALVDGESTSPKSRVLGRITRARLMQRYQQALSQ
ncbi:chloride channel protein [Planctomycetaceae bacterium AH-315-I19]|nr:chloride channel protein [Planctomycetaceae bacterium AH-315-I19]